MVNESHSRERKLYPKFLYDLHKAAGAATKLEHERRVAPVIRRKPKDTTRRSSIEFYEKWH